MKKLFLFAASALMMLGSCTQDEMVNTPMMGEDGKDVIVASIEGQPSTRMTENEGVLSWEDNETFAVFGDNKEIFTISDKSAGTFSGTTPNNAKYAVYYPTDNNLSVTNDVLSITLASKYTSASSLKIPMWGTYENGAILFKHLGAALKVSYNDIPDDYTTLLVEASSPIAGPFSVNLAPIPSDGAIDDDPMAPADQPTTSDANPVIATLSTHNDNNPCEVRVTITSGQDGVFYIPLPVGTYQSLKVSAVKGDVNTSEEKIVLKEWSELEIKRKGLYRTTAAYVQVNANTPAEVSNQIGNLQPNSVVDLTGTIDATATDAGSLALPNADATYNFANTPTTTSEKPLTFTEVEGSDGAKVNINMPANEGDTGIYAVINTPNSTVALEGGTYESLTATTAENTLIIGEGVTIKELIVKGGNVRIEGGTVTKVEKEESKTITYVVKEAKDFNAIPEGVTEVELGGAITATEMIKLEKKGITINGDGNIFTSTAAKAFEVYADATFKNITINGVERCVDTRKAVSLTLENVTLNATSSSASQTLTIGGSEKGTSVTIKKSTISATKYAIITFVTTALTAEESTISGYNALYVKPGSADSAFEFKSSILNGSMGSFSDTEGNSTSTIAVRDNDVTVTVDKESKVIATGYYYYALSLDSTFPGETGPFTGVAVTMNCEVEGNLLDIDNFEDNSIQFKDTYKDALINSGYSVSESDNGMVTVTGVAEAKIGDTLYSTLANAITAVQANETIKLLRDITLMESLTIPTGKDFTFDLNEKTITINAAEGATTVTDFANNGTLTITNGKIVAENKLETRRCIYNYGTMTIDGVEFTQTYGTTQKGAAINNEGKMTIADATVNSVYYSIWNSGAGAELTVKKGTFTCDNIDGMYGYCVMNQLGATLVVDDGEFTGDHGAICINGGKATLNKGTFTCTGVANQTDHVIYVESGATLDYVEADCTFDNSADKELDNSNAPAIYGATGSIITKK